MPRTVDVAHKIRDRKPCDSRDRLGKDCGRFIDSVAGKVTEGDLNGFRCVVLVRYRNETVDGTKPPGQCTITT